LVLDPDLKAALGSCVVEWTARVRGMIVNAWRGGLAPVLD
jgi:hypothetical protein